MGISLDGLASGLDTAALITKLMAIEAAPANLLTARVSATETKISDLQSINQKFAALATLAKPLGATGGLTTFTATSSSTAVTATAGAKAQPGSIDIVVGALAQGQTSVTAPMTAWPDDPAVFTIVGSDGVKHEITAASGSIDDVVSAINGGGAGVAATKVRAGVDGAGNPQYRLQLASNTTGAAAAFTVYRGDAAAVTAGTTTDLLAEPGAAAIRTAQDAQVTLWAGTAAEQVITSASNTFTGLAGDVDVTVSAVSTAAVTVTIARDPATITTAAKDLTDAIKSILGLIDAKSAAIKSTDDAGNAITKLGSFTGDSIVRAARSTLVDAVGMPIGDLSPSQIGLSFSKEGVLTLDPDKLASALEADPEGTEKMLAAIAARVADAATSVSDKYDGSISNAIKGQESVVTSMNDQIDTWTKRLADREATLKRTYSALEVRMSALNSQSAWLTSQIAALPTYSSSNGK